MRAHCIAGVCADYYNTHKVSPDNDSADYCRGSNSNRTDHFGSGGHCGQVISLLEHWSFARTVRIRSGLICSGPGSCMISMGDPYAARSNQVHGWLCSTPTTATRVLLITSWCWIDGSVCPSNTCGSQPSKGKMDRHNLETPVELPSMTLGRNHQNKQGRYI